MIRVAELRCGYPGRRVLDGVTFDVHCGEFVGVLGPNGSGKTTLMLALSGVLPIESGYIAVHGVPLQRMPSRQRARAVASVAQGFDVRFPFPCADVVAMGRYPHQKRWRLQSPEDEAAVRSAMEQTDTTDLAHRPVTEVSGGERQRVMMAKGLAQAAPILLLDEPTSAMDINRKLQIFRLLRDLNLNEERTVLTVLHDINLAALFCRRMIFLKEGRIAADGPADRVLTPEILEAVYDVPVLVRDVPETGTRQVVFVP